MKAKPQGQRPARRLLYIVQSPLHPIQTGLPPRTLNRLTPRSCAIWEPRTIGKPMAGPFKWYIRIVTQVFVKGPKIEVPLVSFYNLWFYNQQVILVGGLAGPRFWGSYPRERTRVKIGRSRLTLVNTYTRYTPGKWVWDNFIPKMDTVERKLPFQIVILRLRVKVWECTIMRPWLHPWDIPWHGDLDCWKLGQCRGWRHKIRGQNDVIVRITVHYRSTQLCKRQRRGWEEVCN